jgi:sugar phosphate isomerase/epimerase
MKLAVSNIAWTNEEEPAVAQLLKELDVQYVEIAPTKKWTEPSDTTAEDVESYRAFWAEYGIEIVAFQSMLFNRPELKLFGDEGLRQQTLTYLQDYIVLASQFGAQVLVFGSPKNRTKGNMPNDETQTIAKAFFKELGVTAEDQGTNFCIEPNPAEYGCDFITEARQGIDLVRAVDTEGFGLHLDIASMTLAGDDVSASIKEAGNLLKHFHISAPFLGQVEDLEDIDYRAAAQALADIGYERFVSIEMKPEASGNYERVKKAVRFAQKIF